MPTYLYVCQNDKGRDPPCRWEREIWWHTIPDRVPQVIYASCLQCNGSMRLVVGKGVITRFGLQWVKNKALDEGRIKRSPEGDLGLMGE